MPPPSNAAFLPTSPIPIFTSQTRPSALSLHPRRLQNPPPRPHRSSTTTLVSVADIGSTTHETSSATRLDNLIQHPTQRRFIFFGGKGGVGKTSTAASVAIKCADEGLVTLVISTDPAHSLGDALRLDLSHGDLTKVDPSIELYAIESDTSEAVRKFRTLVSSLNAPQPSSSNPDHDSSAWGSVASKLKLQEFSDVLETIPPGADELIALVSVLDLVENDNPDIAFDRIIIDTAPTGHTLRLLAFPDFLDKFLTHALALRKKLNNAQGMVGNVAKMFTGKKVDVNSALEKTSIEVEEYRDKMIELSNLFRDPQRTEFVVVTIATVLAVEESKRLIQKLWDEGIWVRHAIINQVLPQGDESTVDHYLAQLRKGQAREISFATEQIADEYSLSVTTVPRFDTEVRGVYGLASLGTIAFRDKQRTSYNKLFQDQVRVSNGNESQFVFVGGKGGVGKTSLSASLGVTLAAEGLKTLILSTDPAHSLADALQVSLDGGAAVPIQVQEGELFAMEIDTERAIEEFQSLAKEFVAEGRGGVGVDMARKIGLEEFAGLLDNAPPGIDELVALTQVMDLVKFGDFDRVVIDTAPTGHTLRLLSFPEFLDSFLGKLMNLKKRLDSALDTIRNVLGRKQSVDVVDKAAQGVERLRENMEELRRLVTDKERTQFAIVTVPTGLAMAESERLVRSLRKDGIEVENLIINQVIADGSAGRFVERIVDSQGKCIEELTSAGAEKKIAVTQVPFFDVEVRGIYALRAMAGSLFKS